MTDAEIDALTLEQLRMQIAERIMKLELVYPADLTCGNVHYRQLGESTSWLRCQSLPDYPNDIEAALTALGKVIRALGVQIILLPDESAEVSLIFAPTMASSFQNLNARGPTLAIAACRAALKAAERKIP